MTTLLVRAGERTDTSATYEPVTYRPGQPDVYADIERSDRLVWRRWDWTIWSTTGSVETEWAYGSAWTHDGAVARATAAAHRRADR